jgi:hypothetical protein
MPRCGTATVFYSDPVHPLFVSPVRMFGIKNVFQRLNTFAHALCIVGQLQQTLLFILR